MNRKVLLMYKTVPFAVMAFLAAAGLSLAAEQTWTGVIRDTMGEQCDFLLIRRG